MTGTPEPEEPLALRDNPPPAERERAVAALARERLDDLVRFLFAAVTETVPSYGETQSEADRDDMLHGIAFTTSLFLSTICEQRLLTSAERRGLQRIGAQRFRQGVTTEDLAAMLEVTRRAGYRFLLTLVPNGNAHDADGLEVAAALSDRLSTFMPLVTAELKAGYKAVQAAPVIDGRARAVLVDRVLDRRWSDTREIVEHGRRVGVDLTRKWGVVFALPLRDGPWSPRRAAQALGEILGPTVVGQERSAPVPHVPILACPRDREPWCEVVDRLAQPARAQQIIVAHAAPDDPVGLDSVVWQQADPLLRFARLSCRHAPVVSLRHLAHLAVLSGAAPADRLAFVREVLGSLLDDPRLVDTLQATYDAPDSTVDQVASLLHCHKNTVYLRWAKIERLTGLDLTVPLQRQELFNAFLIWRCLCVELDGDDGDDVDRPDT